MAAQQWHASLVPTSGQPLSIAPCALPAAAELTLGEAAAAAAARRQHLQGQVDARTAELAGILAHLRLVEQALADLEQLRQQGMDG